MPTDKPEYKTLTFGFDIGIASVGWAVISQTRIIDLGVRCFDAAEVPKTGESLNKARRDARTARNRLARRNLRLKRLRRVLRDAQLLPDADDGALRVLAATNQELGTWELRAQGLDRLLLPAEWARVVYHLVKHRGFHASRRAETEDPDEEGGRLLQGVKRTEGLMRAKWRTLGEMAVRDESFAQHKRNKAGSYDHSFARKNISAELLALFEAQRGFGNPAASEGLHEQVNALLWQQKAALSGTAMLNMVGRCTFEPAEYRSPKRSFSGERFVWLSKLNNLRIIERGERRALTEAERQAALDLPFKRVKVTYKQLRAAIGLGADAHAGFAGLSYGGKRNKEGKVIDPEESTLAQCPGWHKFKSVLSGAGLEATWQCWSGSALAGDPSMLDQIARAVSIYKSDAELQRELLELGVSSNEAAALLGLQFTEFLQLSNKAIGRLLPHLEAGLRFDEAKVACGYQDQATGTPQVLLPDWPHTFTVRNGKRSKRYEMANPVVRRSLGQARKVLNALIQTYGSPSALHVELARDLSKPFDERRDIKNAQEEFQAEKNAAIVYFVDQIGRPPRGAELAAVP
jgi:CRISPR-associated endonuclease Csn1